jgi:hypothetical protein
VSATLRSRILTAVGIAAAVLLWYAITSGRVERVRTACTDRGGQVVLDLDERGVTFVQWCVLPDGTRERI